MQGRMLLNDLFEIRPLELIAASLLVGLKK
jgi:hypothetical protein